MLYSLHLSPLPALLHWSSRLVCRYPPCTLRWGEQVCSPPSARCCTGEPKPATAPLGAATGTGRAEPPGAAGEGRERPQPPRVTRAPLVPHLPLSAAQSRARAGVPEGTRGSPQRPARGGSGGQGEAAPPPPPGSKDILFFLPRTKDNEEPGDSGTYPTKSSPLANTRDPEDGALLPALPAHGQGRPRARPARERRGQRSAARRHCCPTVGSPARQPSSPPSEAPEPTERRARFGARERNRGRSPGVPGASGGDSAGRRAGAAAAPRPSCAVCVREPPPSPLNSLLPSPRTTWLPGRSSLRRGRGGTARAPPLPALGCARAWRRSPLASPPPGPRALRRRGLPLARTPRLSRPPLALTASSRAGRSNRPSGGGGSGSRSGHRPLPAPPGRVVPPVLSQRSSDPAGPERCQTLLQRSPHASACPH